MGGYLGVIVFVGYRIVAGLGHLQLLRPAARSMGSGYLTSGTLSHNFDGRRLMTGGRSFHSQPEWMCNFLCLSVFLVREVT